MNDIMPDGMCADEQEQDYRNVNFGIPFALKIISFLALNNDEIETTKDVRSLFSVLFFRGVSSRFLFVIEIILWRL